MINPERQHNALQALQRLLAHGRMLAYSEPGTDFKVFFDHLEYLPAMMLETTDATARFEDYLQMVCAEYMCPHVYDLYLKGI